MSSTEDLVKRIMTMKPQLTREAIERLIVEERAKAGNLLTEEAAAHLVASNLGLNAGERMRSQLNIGDLVPGLNDVSISAMAVTVGHPRTFKRNDGSEGRVLSMVVGDKTGTIPVTAWDEKADNIVDSEKVTPGTIVKILHGYTKENDGVVQLNMGNRAQIYVNPMDVSAEDLPTLDELKWTQIGFLKVGRYGVNVKGLVAGISDERTFNRRDGTTGVVASVLLEDNTGAIVVTLWDDDVAIRHGMVDGSVVVVEGGYTKENRGAVNLNLGRDGTIEIGPEGVDLVVYPENRIRSVSSLYEGQTNIHVAGKVIESPMVREVQTARGPTMVASFGLDDGTGEVRVSAWRDLVKEVERLNIGDYVRVENCQVRQPYEGTPQVSTGMFTKVRTNQTPEQGTL